AHQVVVGNAREQVVAARGYVQVRRELRSLQRDVAVLLVRTQALQQLAEPETVGMDRRQRDEDEAIAQLAELTPADRLGGFVPLERARPVEREARLGKPLVDFGRKRFGGLAVGVGELAPDQVR